MNRKPTGPALKTWQFYSACIYHLTKSYLAKLYKKSPGQIERWASDPDTTESHQRNPVDRYETLLKKLMALGYTDVAIQTVARQTRLVGCGYPRAERMPKAEKKTIAEECLDDLPALATFHDALIAPKSTKEEVRHALDQVVVELQQNYTKWCSEHNENPDN